MWFLSTQEVLGKGMNMCANIIKKKKATGLTLRDWGETLPELLQIGNDTNEEVLRKLMDGR